jgi:GNAT superfamily N-acetyltransferase
VSSLSTTLAGQPGYRLRPAGPDDAPAIVGLLNAVYGDWGDLEYWRWKYDAPPAPGRIPSWVAECDGELVGHHGALPVSGILHGQPVCGAQFVDAAVLPTHRRRGIHSSLARLTIEAAASAGISFIYAFPGLLSQRVDRDFGLEPIMFVPEMVRVLDRRRALLTGLRRLPGGLALLWRWRRGERLSPDDTRRLARLRRAFFVLGSWLSDPVWARRSPGRLVAVRPAVSLDRRYDRLAEHLVTGTQLGLLKDASYLAWRYQQHPRHSYQILEALNGDELAGFAVVRLGDAVTELCELVALPDREPVLLALLAAAAQLGRAAASLALAAWIPPEQPAHALLRQAGFVSPRRLHRLAGRWPALATQFYQATLCAAQLTPVEWTHLRQAGRGWSLAMGDSDLV